MRQFDFLFVSIITVMFICIVSLINVLYYINTTSYLLKWGYMPKSDKSTNMDVIRALYLYNLDEAEKLERESKFYGLQAAHDSGFDTEDLGFYNTYIQAKNEYLKSKKLKG